MFSKFRFLFFFYLVHASITTLANVKGSPHDFTGRAWANGEMCIVCHTPHHANMGTTATPLWNHTITSQTYVPYKSNTLKATVGQPDGESKLCLSCHDGTVALDSFGGQTGKTDASGRFLYRLGDVFGTDLTLMSGHPLAHPISFVFDSTLASVDLNLNDPTIPMTSLGGKSIQSTLLFNGKVQCTSCHDVHNKAKGGDLLRLSESVLCTTCHKKM